MREANSASLITSITSAPTAWPDGAAHTGATTARSVVKASCMFSNALRRGAGSSDARGASRSRSSSAARALTSCMPTTVARPDRRWTICFSASSGPSVPFCSTSTISSSMLLQRFLKPAMKRLRASRKAGSESAGSCLSDAAGGDGDRWRHRRRDRARGDGAGAGSCRECGLGTGRQPTAGRPRTPAEPRFADAGKDRGPLPPQRRELPTATTRQGIPTSGMPGAAPAQPNRRTRGRCGTHRSRR